MKEKESAHFARNDGGARGGGLESRRRHGPSKLRINESCRYNRKQEAERGHDVSCPYGRVAGRRGGAPTALAFQYALDPLRAASNNRQIGLRWLIGCGAALLPIAQRAEGNVKPLGEFLLSQTQCAANDFCLRSALHALYCGAAQRLCIRVSKRSAFDCTSGHGTKRFMGFSGDRFPAHVSSPSGRV